MAGLVNGWYFAHTGNEIRQYCWQYRYMDLIVAALIPYGDMWRNWNVTLLTTDHSVTTFEYHEMHVEIVKVKAYDELLLLGWSFD